MVRRLELLLGEVMDRPDVPLHALRILPESERAQVLLEFNDTRGDVPLLTPGTLPCVHQLFEAQVARTPDAVALCFDDGEQTRTLTYRELDLHANQLAWSLCTRGVGPERVVAVLLERSLYLGKNIPWLTCDWPQDANFQAAVRDARFNRAVTFEGRALEALEAAGFEPGDDVEIGGITFELDPGAPFG